MSSIYKKDNLKDTLHIDALKDKLKFRRIRPGVGENIGIDRIQNEAGTKEKFLPFTLELKTLDLLRVKAVTL